MEFNSFEEAEEYLRQMHNDLHPGHDAEVHIVPVSFSWGTCEQCGDHNCARLPVGLNGMQVCAMCGQHYQEQGERYLEELFEAHMRSHAAQWN